MILAVIRSGENILFRRIAYGEEVRNEWSVTPDRRLERAVDFCVAEWGSLPRLDAEGAINAELKRQGFKATYQDTFDAELRKIYPGAIIM